MKHKQDIATGSVFLVISGALLLQASDLPAGAALLPSVALGAIMVLSAILVLRGLRAAHAASTIDDGQLFIESPKRLLIGIAAIGVYIFAIETVGFYPATALFVPVTAFVLGARNLIGVIVAGVSFLLFTYVVFDLLFERVMPAGFLFSAVDAGTKVLFNA